MKSWNTHAWYVTGILTALLIGSLSVKWNDIKELPGILSFALGFASLLLALIAIVQSLTANDSVNGTLGAVREAADGIVHSVESITKATDELKLVGQSMMETSEKGLTELKQLRGDLAQKNQQFNADASLSEKGDQFKSFGPLTFGTGPALLALVLSFKSGKEFSFSDIFPEEEDTYYESGVVGGLRISNFIKTKFRDQKYKVIEINADIDELEQYVLTAFSNTTKKNSLEYKTKIELVKSYFEN